MSLYPLCSQMGSLIIFLQFFNLHGSMLLFLITRCSADTVQVDNLFNLVCYCENRNTYIWNVSLLINHIIHDASLRLPWSVLFPVVFPDWIFVFRSVAYSNKSLSAPVQIILWAPLPFSNITHTQSGNSEPQTIEKARGSALAIPLNRQQ